MDPINYTTAVLNPLQMAMQGYQAGQQGRAGELGIRQGEQQMQLAANQDQRAQEQLAMQQQALAQQQAAEAEAKAGQQAMVALYSNPNPTADDFKAAMAANPSAAQEIRTWWDSLDPPQQDNNALFAKQLAYTLGKGNIEVARSIIETRMLAAENTPGGKEMADTLKSQLHMLDMGPEGAKSLLLTTMGGLSMVLPGDEFNKFQADVMPTETEWRTATPEELAQHPGAIGGQTNIKTGEFKADSNPQQLSITTNKDGTTTVTQGRAGAMDTNTPKVDTGVDAMINTIDGVLNDPALPYSTGAMSFLQSIPGLPQKGFGAKAEQLKGQAFLQAYQSLRGAGQITEIESEKATAAIGRLDTAQSAADYKAALTELRDILVTAKNRASGISTEGPGPNDVIHDISDDVGFGALKNGDWFRTPDGTVMQKTVGP